MRFKRPDTKDALSIVEAARREIEVAFLLEVNETFGFTIVRNIYEGFRMLGDALLVKKGIESYDHLQPLNELLKLNVSAPRSINVVENLRILRHNINYYGYKPKIDEVEDIVSFAKDCFEIVAKEVLRQINGP